MRIPRIYTPQALTPNSKVELDAEASHHILKVLRMDVGRPLTIFNGDGDQHTGSISRINGKSAVVILQNVETLPNIPEIDIEIAIGMSKGDRLEWVIQKATELGAAKIVPLFTERCEIKLNAERAEKKLTSWKQVAISACEQSQRNVLPNISAPTKLADYLEKCHSDVKFIMHHRSEKSLQSISKPNSAAILIGPEGGLSDNEIKLAQARGFAPLKIGPRIMRTETAPLSALSIMQYLWGDLN
ncbi:MAG: 16S rRNA (uracil(1498)-N(3))-methyltransferase [Agarilytica sp.]